ncbi:HAD family hydrolase [Alishewanella jeotgali]|uniref:HAD superfamily hydrolase-like protein n=1 Tax=Alishewanella jeotgali KCTC 22429 TaxID=1129374 RepID=H3ZBJ7_9ALTE|nr:HAD family hydrolase [Alishewanella jeotgali]EHR42311.1 HAD superfamily hydrolase-like protein [Alishewanella jeotgali KCTC 22429]
MALKIVLPVGVTVVCVDIFDTLLLRDGCSEKARFYATAREVNKLSQSKKSSIEHIFLARLTAHRWLYNLYEKRLIAEPSLREIHKIQCEMLSDEKITISVLEEAEYNFEFSSLKLNSPLVKFLVTMEKSGKKVILLSDMYLSSEFIRKILTQNNAELHCEIYMSNEIGVSKHRGNAFTWIIEKYSVAPDKIHHIGDNYASDYLIPLANKVSATFMPRNKYFYYKERILGLLTDLTLRGILNE